MAYTTTTELIELHPDVRLHVQLSKPTSPALATSPPNVAIVFLHFWGGSSTTWSQFNALVATKRPTVAIDFRGWGRSTGPNDAAGYSIVRLAEDVEHVVRRLELACFILVGHSMGAKVAQAVAGRGNVRGLRGLALLCRAPPTPLVLSPAMRDQQAHAYDNAQSAEFVARNVLAASPLPAGVVESVVADMLRGTAWARSAWPEYAMGDDVSALARGIKVPVMVIAAENDAVEPVSRVEAEVCSNIRHATLVVIPAAGHLVPLEAPERAVENVENFISSLT